MSTTDRLSPAPGTILGVHSSTCLGRKIQWWSTRQRQSLTPNHLAQVLHHPEYGPVWWESTAATTAVPCLFCGGIAGVHVRPYYERFLEIAKRGGVILAYPWRTALSAAQHALLSASWKLKHAAPYGYWDAWHARVRGFGRIINSRWYRSLPPRWQLITDNPGAYYCNEAVHWACRDARIWYGVPSHFNPATAVADLMLKELVGDPMILWRPGMAVLGGAA